MTLGERIEALRTKMRLTQDQMAARLKVSRPYLWQVIHGTKPGGPKLATDVEMMENAQAQRAETKVSGDIMRDVKVLLLRYVPVLTLAQAGDVLVAWENLPVDW